MCAASISFVNCQSHWHRWPFWPFRNNLFLILPSIYICLAPDSNMTKRDSSTADLDFPRNLRFDSWSQPMNPYRHRHASEAASSSAADSPSRQGLRLPGTPATPSHYPPPPQFGYSSSAPAIPVPTADQNWHHQGADRDVSTSPGTSYPYIQRSHYIPIRHSSAKIDDHGGWQSRNGTQSSTAFFLQWNDWSCTTTGRRLCR